MEVDLISEETFTVSANGKSIPRMRVVSEWEGLKKLTDPKGRSMVVIGKNGPFAEAIMGFMGHQPRGAIVVAGNPDLIRELSPEKPQS